MNTQPQIKPLDSQSALKKFFAEFMLLPHYRLFFIFAVLAITTRVIFMFYTGWIWEDALIALTSARNVWEGFGLTHHVSEPRVQSFSSVLGELIMIAGEALRQGLLAVQLASFAASVICVYFAFTIGASLSFNGIAQSLVFSYLAMDHLQIFFGIGGMMETLAPNFAVLRPDVLHDTNVYLPQTAELYKTVSHVTLEKPLDLSHWGLLYALIDNDFIILQRKSVAR